MIGKKNTMVNGLDPDEPLGGNFKTVDYEGMQKRQDRMANGFILFGKYYESLWD